MRDSSRSAAEGEGGDTREGAPEPGAAASSEARTSATPSVPPKPYLGHAMKALFESSDVSIRRGDETRVMSRAQEALAEISRKSGPPAAESGRATEATISSHPPAPRVDAVLWIVLAVGLFAIAGWMVAYAL